ncbi:hypothetical protein [Streptomyces hiroshimensis]
MPTSLLDGAYTKEKDLSQALNDGLAGQRSGRNERNMKGAGGQYTNASGEGPQTIVVSGLYGEITDPKRAMTSMLKGVSETPGIEVTTPAKDVTPSGAAGPVTCEVYSVTGAGDGTGQPGTISTCGWSDRSTVATVSVTEPIPLEDLAKKTDAIRNQVRVPRQ